MKSGHDWNDLAYFAAIARSGGLTGAARELGVRAVTLSRRVKAFAASLGRRLFIPGAEGYALTADGRALAEGTRGMDNVVRQVSTWRDAPSPTELSAHGHAAPRPGERRPGTLGAVPCRRRNLCPGRGSGKRTGPVRGASGGDAICRPAKGIVETRDARRCRARVESGGWCRIRYGRRRPVSRVPGRSGRRCRL